MEAAELQSRLIRPDVTVVKNDSRVDTEFELEVVYNREIVAIIYGATAPPYGLRRLSLERRPHNYDSDETLVAAVNAYLATI